VNVFLIGYARRFIDMYLIASMDNALLNKIMINLRLRLYEIIFICFPGLMKEEGEGGKATLNYGEFLKKAVKGNTYIKFIQGGRKEEEERKIALGERFTAERFPSLSGVIYGINVAYQKLAYTCVV